MLSSVVLLLALFARKYIAASLPVFSCRVVFVSVSCLVWPRGFVGFWGS